jgi:hypothetical protein
MGRGKGELMGSKEDGAAAKARADRREAERQARLKTGKPAGSVLPQKLAQARRRAREN